MGGALALAATLNGAAFLGIDAHAERIKRHVKTGYCEVMVNDLDEALRILKNAVRKREPASVGLIAHPAELIPALARRGVLPDLLTDQTYADEPYVPHGLTTAQALESSEKDPRAYVKKVLDSIAAQFRGMLELKKMGSVIFVFGNEMEARALARSVAEPNEMPKVISDYLAPDLARGRGPLTIVALSGDPGDLTRVDDLFQNLFPDGELREWIAIARKHPSPGLPARSCLIGRDEAVKLGAAINDLVARAAIKAPVAMGRSIRQTEGGNLLGSQPLCTLRIQRRAPRGLPILPRVGRSASLCQRRIVALSPGSRGTRPGSRATGSLHRHRRQTQNRGARRALLCQRLCLLSYAAPYEKWPSTHISRTIILVRAAGLELLPAHLF